MSTQHFVELKHITKRFGSNTVIEDFNLAVDKGEMVTLLGPSGCGKTTILRLIAGLEQATSGQILIDGEDVTHRAIQQRDIGMVFQSYALFPHMSLGENIGYGLKMSGMPKAEREKRIEEALELVDLAGFANRYVDQISGGQQQRVALARALVLKPKVLLFDEPLSNLDANLRRSMREKIRELQQHFRITSFYVTHDQSEAFAVSDRVLVMKKGQIMQMASPQQLYRHPASRFMANFMGDANILQADYQPGVINIYGYQIALADAFTVDYGRYLVGIRPEALSLSKQGEVAQQCQIESVAYMGAFYEVIVNWHGESLFLQVNSLQMAPQIGESFYLHIDPRGMFILPD